jgi:hypothetical protein
MTSAAKTVLAALGVLAVAVAAGVVVGVAPAALLGPADGLDATLATGLLGAGLVAYAFRRRRAHAPDADRRLVADPDAPAVRDPGEYVDRALDHVAADATGRATRDHREHVRERVRETAVRAYAHGADTGEDAAREAVAAGEWTDDRLAAAFLGDERAPRYPLRERLRGWLHPGRAFRRRAQRAADAAHTLAEEVAT